MHRDEPDRLVAARRDSPLIVGIGEGENIVASDIPAVLEYTRDVLVLSDGQVARSGRGVTVVDAAGQSVEPEMMHVEWDLDAAEKGGYEDFMLKEIFEQPKAIRETLRGRMGDDGAIQLSELDMTEEQVAAIDRVFIIACGTSYHAGLVAKTLIEQWARVPVEVDVSSEFRYSGPDRRRPDAGRGDHAVGRDRRHAGRCPRGARTRSEGHGDHERRRAAG